jgi:hypothetical protein
MLAAVTSAAGTAEVVLVEAVDETDVAMVNFYDESVKSAHVGKT